MLKITKKQKQAMKENEWIYNLILKAECKQGITSVGIKILNEYMDTNLKKNKDTYTTFMEYQFRVNNKFKYDEYQILVDMVLLGK